VVEGLLAGAAVVTTRDACLKEIGFVSEVDFMELRVFENPLDDLSDYSIEDFRLLWMNRQKELKV